MRLNIAFLLISLGMIWSCLVGTATSEEKQKRNNHRKSLQSMQRNIEGLYAKNHRWREIRWNRCLLEGMARSHSKDKPILLWVFLHNPNDERC